MPRSTLTCIPCPAGRTPGAVSSSRLTRPVNARPGSTRRIDFRLHWYLAKRQRRLLKKIDHLADEITDSIAGITAVIACITGMTSGTDEPGRYIAAAEGYEEHRSLRHLSDVERALRDVLSDDESTLTAFFETALDFLGACDGVLQEFAGGIELSSSS
jgi:hexokinase